MMSEGSVKIAAPVKDLKRIYDNGSYVSGCIDFDILKFFGVFVLKAALAEATVKKYTQSYYSEMESARLKKTEFHLTEVKLGEDQFLRKIANESEFIKAVSGFFDGNVGVDFVRVVKKDKTNAEPVFRHQDTCYQIGGFERYSLFVPLTKCSYENGGLILYPGTHNFGYLGDAGEIAAPLPAEYPIVKSEAHPGDILIMHSGTWHESPVNSALTDRVYLEVHIQHIDEPTTKISVCGQKKSTWTLQLSEDEIFRNSRTQLRTLYKEVEDLKKDL